MSSGMDSGTGTDPHDSLPGVVPKPADAREWSIRAVIAGVVVAAIMGASYPYIVLKLGFGPNVSVVAAFFGYLFLGILFRNFNRWENNIVQTAGTSAAQTAFMCIILAAFDLVSQNKDLHYSFQPTVMQSFQWLTAASILGLLLAVPLRRHYIVDEKLTYADGVAAAETIVVLDARGPEAKSAARESFFMTGRCGRPFRRASGLRRSNKPTWSASTPGAPTTTKAWAPCASAAASALETSVWSAPLTSTCATRRRPCLSAFATSITPREDRRGPATT